MFKFRSTSVRPTYLLFLLFHLLPTGLFYGCSSDSNKAAVPTDILKKVKNASSIDELFAKQDTVVLEASPEVLIGSVADLCTDSKERLLIVDARNHCIFMFTKNGKFIKKIGEKGEGPGQFKGPSGITIDLYGRVYVTDPGNVRINVFNEEGEYLTTFKLKRPGYGIAIGTKNRLYVQLRGLIAGVDVYDSLGVLMGSSGDIPEINRRISLPVVGGSVALDSSAVYYVHPIGYEIEKFSYDLKLIQSIPLKLDRINKLETGPVSRSSDDMRKWWNSWDAVVKTLALENKLVIAVIRKNQADAERYQDFAQIFDTKGNLISTDIVVKHPLVSSDRRGNVYALLRRAFTQSEEIFNPTLIRYSFN